VVDVDEGEDLLLRIVESVRAELVGSTIGIDERCGPGLATGADGCPSRIGIRCFPFDAWRSVRGSCRVSWLRESDRFLRRRSAVTPDDFTSQRNADVHLDAGVAVTPAVAPSTWTSGANCMVAPKRIRVDGSRSTAPHETDARHPLAETRPLGAASQSLGTPCPAHRPSRATDVPTGARIQSPKHFACRAVDGFRRVAGRRSPG
jgi:hypothetical protein